VNYRANRGIDQRICTWAYRPIYTQRQLGTIGKDNAPVNRCSSRLKTNIHRRQTVIFRLSIAMCKPTHVIRPTQLDAET